MRRDIVHPGAGQLRYEIREIVEFAKKLGQWDISIIWENIGDPIAKGEQIESWIKEIISKLTLQDDSYGYVDTQGIQTTREFLSQQVNKRGGAQITPNDIIFFNGLGDAVAKLFGFLKREARILGPSPAYSTLSSAEAAHSGYAHLTYDLDPDQGWQPNLKDIENKVKYNDAIAGILLINPDNPTGAVYPKETLLQIVEIARKYNIFIICDETYANIVFPSYRTAALSEVIGEVPGIALRSLSKEIPWPGARCGWIEVFNQDSDDNFSEYINSLLNAKRLEVCSTSLPQKAIPALLGHPNYPGHLEKRAKVFEDRAKEASQIFDKINGIKMIQPKGALYFTIVFEEGVLKDGQYLSIPNDDLRIFIESNINNLEWDKRFVYYLLAQQGICVVPLSGFASPLKGFRMTLLEVNDGLRREIYQKVGIAIEEYLSSQS
ncbi:pyridoxal phosphate-dependent aminotransferase [Spirochaeta cellobiosiphila]|uniref:pyridoxal phosphate-dependent aminotransferase n=1 Tax=Spirochaeta cellobiosiphila TaxID=504483 RepID=UPI0003FF6C35|nr:pyridoxal phosphate-dependent aminotransferase [Spirochaeta cellobiosiphila]